MSRIPVPRLLVAYNGANAGLGNRVRVTLGCQVLAEYERRHFCYVWPTGPLFGPRFDELWDHRGGRVIGRGVSRVLAKAFPYVDADNRASRGAQGGPLVRQIRTGGEILVPDGCPSWKDRFRALQPVPEIADVVRHHATTLAGRPYVGVQIRAHAVSHEVTKQSSPVEWFLERMEELRRHDPGVRFFVSCDVPEVFDRVVAQVPGCTGIRDKGLYNSTRAVRAAIADLYLLAGAGHLLGPYGSSFVHLARYLSEERLGMETARDARHGPVDVSALGLADDPLRPATRRPA